MFYLIGLGLGDPNDIPQHSLEVIRKCKRIYLEAYTSILLHGGKESLEEFYGNSITLADRELVEQGASDILEGAESDDIALLVVGDPLGATTHTDLILRAHEQNIKVKVYHNASIMSAVGITGLDRNKFGEVVSIPFWDGNWKPDSFCQKINANLKNGLHTLCLLDIKVKEQSIENIMKNRKIYDPPRYMRTHQAADQLLQIVADNEESLLNKDTPCVACVRLGTPEQQNILASLQDLESRDLGEPLHSMVVCSELSTEEKTNCEALMQHFRKKEEPSDETYGVLHLIGIGMTSDDITMKGREVIQKCKRNYVDVSSLEMLAINDHENELIKLISKGESLPKTEYCFDISNVGELLKLLKEGNDVSVCVWGDPLIFTQYSSLLSKVINENIHFEVIHNVSIINSIASCGLQLYSFGETVFITNDFLGVDKKLFKEKITADNSFINKLVKNKTNGWHSLCMFKHLSDSTISKTPFTLCQLLLDSISEVSSDIIKDSDKIILVTDIGCSDVKFEVKTLKDVVSAKEAYSVKKIFAIVIPGYTHPLEEDYLKMLSITC